MIFYVTTAIYNIILLVGTAWLVGWQGWSGWWFVLTICLLANSTHRLCNIGCDEKECKKR